MLRQCTMLVNSIACCIFGGLFIFLFATRTDNPGFSTWHENVVVSTSADLNDTMHHLNSTLIQLCSAKKDGDLRMSLPLVGFSLNSTQLSGTVFTAANATYVNSKLMLALVILVSFNFHAWRLLTQPPVTHDRSKAVHDEHGPDFLRWVEYTLSSPPMIAILCGILYIRNITEITLMCTLQGALALSGWTVEQLISMIEFEKYYFSNGYITSNVYPRVGMLGVVFGGSVVMHCVIWLNLLTRYFTHEDNFRACALGLAALPPIVGQIVVVQGVLFSLFGLVPLFQILYVVLVDKTSSSFGVAGLAYSILSIVSKGVLTFMFVKLITDGNCLHTEYGHACV